MYQLLSHQMAQVRMKITRPPSITNCLRDSNYYTLKFKHPLTYTLYAHAHTGTL